MSGIVNCCWIFFPSWVMNHIEWSLLFVFGKPERRGKPQNKHDQWILIHAVCVSSPGLQLFGGSRVLVPRADSQWSLQCSSRTARRQSFLRNFLLREAVVVDYVVKQCWFSCGSPLFGKLASPFGNRPLHLAMFYLHTVRSHSCTAGNVIKHSGDLRK